MWKFQLKFKLKTFWLFYCRIWTTHAWKLSRTLTSMDNLEHRAFIKFCMQSGTSPFKPKGSYMLQEMAHISLGQWLTNGIRCLKMEGLIFSALAATPSQFLNTTRILHLWTLFYGNFGQNFLDLNGLRYVTEDII